MFCQKDLYVLPDDEQRVYYRRTGEKKVAVPWGQRKLFMIEVAFFSLYWDPKMIPCPKVIYAGAAPGKHIEQLSSMYPEMEFYLWDPRTFDLLPSDKIHIYQDYFTEETAKEWSDRNDVFFISDIRTADYKKIDNADENERQILDDMYRQQNWYKIINPVKALLKFRLPYTDTNMPKKIKYLDGDLLKQPWAPQTSTETRLIPYGTIEKEWDAVVYEEQLFHFNTIVRENKFFNNIFDNSENPIFFPELLNDFDSIAESFILRLYLKQRNLDTDVNSVVLLSNTITKSINKGKSFQDSISALRLNTRLIKDRNSSKRQKKITIKYAKTRYGREK